MLEQKWLTVEEIVRSAEDELLLAHLVLSFLGSGLVQGRE